MSSGYFSCNSTTRIKLISWDYIIMKRQCLRNFWDHIFSQMDISQWSEIYIVYSFMHFISGCQSLCLYISCLENKGGVWIMFIHITWPFLFLYAMNTKFGIFHNIIEEYCNEAWIWNWWSCINHEYSFIKILVSSYLVTKKHLDSKFVQKFCTTTK